MVYRTIIFLIINFAALGIGGALMGKGPVSDWYLGLDKAPWTPPGWVFGAAWTFIMITFAFYMAYAWEFLSSSNFLLWIFILQWVLNVAWNPIFFRFHMTSLGLAFVLALTIVVAYIFLAYLAPMKWKSLYILPYLVWLVLATSLNAYVVIKN